jgi:drug/metabolite transporter (DMT)-like permease
VKPERLGLLLGVVGVVVFGGTLPFTRLAVQGLDPWFVTAGRAALAGVLASIVLLVLRRSLPRGGNLRTLGFISICLVGGFPMLTGLAMTSVDASHGGVVLGILPLATAAAGALISGERPSPGFWCTAVAGAALVTAFALRDGASGVGVGDAFLAAAVAAAALGYAASGKLARSMPGWEVISWALVLALPVTVPLALIWWPASPSAIPAASWWGFAYVTLMSQYLGFFAWNAGLALGGVARVGQVQLLQTFVTLGIAAVLNGERVDTTTWLCAGGVVVLVVAGSRFRSRRVMVQTTAEHGT